MGRFIINLVFKRAFEMNYWFFYALVLQSHYPHALLVVLIVISEFQVVRRVIHKVCFFERVISRF